VPAARALSDAAALTLPAGVLDDGYIVQFQDLPVSMKTDQSTRKLKPAFHQRVDLIVEVHSSGPSAPPLGSNGNEGSFSLFVASDGAEYVVRLQAHDQAKRTVGVDVVTGECGSTFAVTLAKRQPTLDAWLAADSVRLPITTVVECLAKRRGAADAAPRSVERMSLVVVQARDDKVGADGTMRPNALRTVARTLDDVLARRTIEQVVEAASQRDADMEHA
jgi:hypothetical protein